MAALRHAWGGAAAGAGAALGRSCRCAGLTALALLSAAAPAWSWGDKGHRLVNRLAVETLPADAAAYYGPRVDVLARRAVEPDTVMRAREGQAEGIRHFINLDAHLPAPFTDFPRSYRKAVRRFGRQAVEQHGVLPWVIVRFQRQLRAAIQAGDVARAMREAAYLGHYVADAYVPLHLTIHHDGRGVEAQGLHKRFEDGMVDARIRAYAAAVRRLLEPAQAVPDPRRAIFDAMVRSYAALEPILRADATARGENPTGSPAYYARLEELAGPVARRQLAAAASMLGSLWLTAWQEARAAAPREGTPPVRAPTALDRPPAGG